MEHASLKKLTPTPNVPTKPLVDAEELREMAKTTLLKEIESQMLKIAHDETKLEQIQQTLDNMQSTLVEIRENKNEFNALKLDVLQRLKNKLVQADV